MTLQLKYNWVKTCDACPEQYDVFDEDGRQIAYVRARWGHVTAECPDALDARVFEASFSDDGYDGCFHDDDHRQPFFTEIENAITDYYKEQTDV